MPEVLRVYDGEQTLPAHGHKQNLTEQGREKNKNKPKKPEQIQPKKPHTQIHKHACVFLFLARPKAVEPRRTAAGPPWARG